MYVYQIILIPLLSKYVQNTDMWPNYKNILR